MDSQNTSFYEVLKSLSFKVLKSLLYLMEPFSIMVSVLFVKCEKFEFDNFVFVNSAVWKGYQCTFFPFFIYMSISNELSFISLIYINVNLGMLRCCWHRIDATNRSKKSMAVRVFSLGKKLASPQIPLLFGIKILGKPLSRCQTSRTVVVIRKREVSNAFGSWPPVC